MTLAVYLPLVICVAVAASAPPLARRMSPGVGAWLLAVVSAVTSVSVLWSLILLVASLIDDVPWLTHGQRPLPVNDGLSLVALAILPWLCARIGRYWYGHSRFDRQLRTIDGEHVVVLPDSRAIAFAHPGRGGRIVVSEGMLSALSPEQRRVLFAHERAHLDARHPAALNLANLAAAANPVLTPAARAVAFLCERHADERAAAAIDDRLGAATALAAAALATRRPATGPICGFDENYVVERIGALRQPARRPSRTMPAWAVLALVGTVAAAISATIAFVNLTVQFLDH